MSKTPKKTRRLGQGVLALIAGLFLASSVVRVSQSAGAASSGITEFRGNVRPGIDAGRQKRAALYRCRSYPHPSG